MLFLLLNGNKEQNDQEMLDQASSNSDDGDSRSVREQYASFDDDDDGVCCVHIETQNTGTEVWQSALNERIGQAGAYTFKMKAKHMNFWSGKLLAVLQDSYVVTMT